VPAEQLILLPIEAPPRLPALPLPDTSEIVSCLADLLLQVATEESEGPATREVDDEILR
jgi:hypothetical protein